MARIGEWAVKVTVPASGRVIAYSKSLTRAGALDLAREFSVEGARDRAGEIHPPARVLITIGKEDILGDAR